MLEIKINLLPYGSRKKETTLYTLVIANVGKKGGGLWDYLYSLWEKDNNIGNGKVSHERTDNLFYLLQLISHDIIRQQIIGDFDG